MFRILSVVPLLALLAGGAFGPVSAQCAPMDDRGNELLGWLRDLAVATDEDDREERDSLRLPAVSESEVTLVQDSATCSAASEAFYRDEASTVPRYAVHVVRVGNVYVVTDNRRRIGEWTSHKVFDSTFVTRLARFAG